MTITVRLTDGNVLESDAENNFPAFRDLGYPPEFDVCPVCPIREACEDHDPVVCVELGLFEGFPAASCPEDEALAELRRVGAIME